MTPHSQVYGAHGESIVSGHMARLAYAGEIMESDTSWYLLGNRLYSPALRRFLGPDPESPFNDGGVNRYVYCSGDPINRIDPGGDAWTDWLMAGLAVGLSVLGTIFSAGALAGTVAAAGGFVAALSAPGIVATAAAATLDVVSTVASVGSIASMATRDQKANSIFGWVGMAAGMGSAAATVTAAKQGAFGVARGATQGAGAARRASTASSASISSTSSAGARSAASASTGTSTLGKVASAVSLTRAPMPAITSSASARIQRRHSTGSLVTPDATTSRPQLRRALSGLGADGVKATTLYTGLQGSRQGFRNPHARSERPSGSLYRDTLEAAEQAGTSAGVKVAAADMTTLTKEQVRRRLSEDDIHVVVSGHGLIDEVTMQALNMTSQVSDHLLPVRGGL